MRATFLFFITFGLFFLNWSCFGGSCDGSGRNSADLEGLMVSSVLHQDTVFKDYIPGDTVTDLLEIWVAFDPVLLASVTSLVPSLYATEPCPPPSYVIQVDSIVVSSNGQKMDSLLVLNNRLLSGISGELEFFEKSFVLELFSRPETTQMLDLRVDFFESNGDVETVEIGEIIIAGK